MPNANTYLAGTIQIPSWLYIENITNARQAVVTISVNNIVSSNTFIPGQLLKFFVPPDYGMIQINGQTGQILAVSGSDFTIDIDTRLYDIFTTPISPKTSPATVTPAGSRNLTYSNDTNNVPFQSLNNIGN